VARYGMKPGLEPYPMALIVFFECEYCTVMCDVAGTGLETLGAGIEGSHVRCW
jgi:hypothetical protein